MPSNKSAAPSKRALNIICLVACAALMALIAVGRSQSTANKNALNDSAPTMAQKDSTLTVMPNGTIVVNTSEIGKDCHGYGGKVPLKVYFKNGKVDHVEALPNNETSDFFNVVLKSGLLEAWNGKTPSEALAMQIDGISGATYSSRGVTGNMNAALAYAARHITQDADGTMTVAAPIDYRLIAAIAVALLAALLPLFIRSRKYRLVQQVLNIGVLGFWSGTFLCHASLLSLFSAGASLAVIPAIIMVITAFVYPLFGKKNYYCNNICPFGSLQELASHCSKRKLRIPAKLIRTLEWLRRIVWALLMLLLWSETFTAWLDWELFAAFSPTVAAIPVTIAAAAFIVLSVFVPRPYCRFLCPTGTLFKAAQGKW